MNVIKNQTGFTQHHFLFKKINRIFKTINFSTPKSSAGFTLMEIATVLAVIVIMTLTSIPFFSRYNQNQALDNSAKKLIGLLKEAQQNTVTQQIKYSIQFTPLSNTYTLIKKGNPDQIISSEQIDSNIIFSEIIDLVSNEAVFNPTGAVDYSGEVYLQHTVSGQQVHISIKPSGFITWERVAP